MGLKYWTIFFLVIAAQGLLVGLFLLSRSRTWNSASIHLSILIFSFSVTLGLWVGFWNNWNFHIVSLNFTYNSIPLLYGPALYLHLRAAHGDSRLINSLHYLPFFIVFSFFLPFYLMDFESKLIYLQRNLEEPNIGIILSGYLQSASVIIYLLLLYKFKIVDKKKEKWTKTVTTCFMIFVIANQLNMHVLKLIINDFAADIIGALIMAISIYTIGYMAFHRLSVFKRLDLSKPNKYNRSSLTKKYAEIIVEKLDSFLTQDKVFKSSEMTLAEVARRIEIPTHHISESLNKYEGVNYSDFINHLRVQEAKEMLRSPDYDNLKVESIGYAVGFNSKTTFYNAFKKETGKSPANYQKEMRLLPK